MQAVEEGSIGLVELLITGGAEIEALDRYGESARTMAKQKVTRILFSY